MSLKIFKKHGLLKSRPRWRKPDTIVLHHTGGSSLSGAESHLKSIGLGYHYMIDRDGSVYEYGPPTSYMSHAYRRNANTIGISYVGGYHTNARKHVNMPINVKQYESLTSLMRKLKHDIPSIKRFTGHKHIDPRTKSSRWPAKPDPHWPGDTVRGYVTGENWERDEDNMDRLSELVDLPWYSELKGQ